MFIHVCKGIGICPSLLKYMFVCYLGEVGLLGWPLVQDEA